MNFHTQVSLLETNFKELANVGKKGFLKKMNSNTNSDFGKRNIYSPSLHQAFNEKLTEYFNNYITGNVIQNICSEEDLDPFFEEKLDYVHFEKSDIEMDISEPMENFIYPPEINSDYTMVNTLHSFSEEVMNHLRIQAPFKRCRRSNVSTFISSQDYYEHPKKTFGPMEKDI